MSNDRLLNFQAAEAANVFLDERDAAEHARRNGKAAKPVEPELDIISAADIVPKPIEWFWKSRFPSSSLSIIAGDPEAGKSLITCDIAARVSTGTPWPGLPDESNPVGESLLFLCEDHLEQVVRPRLDLARADVTKIGIVKGVKFEESDRRDGFVIEAHVNLLDKYLQAHRETRLVSLDPLDSYLGISDGHNKLDVQRSLHMVSELAQRYDVAILGVLHLRKDASTGKAIHKLMGSMGFVSVPRAIWGATLDADDPKRRLFLKVKLSIAESPGGMSYTTEGPDPGRVVWLPGSVATTADEAIGGGKGDDKRAGTKACDFLTELLAVGEMESGKIKELAREQGIKSRTLWRAKGAAGVKARCKADGLWYWRLA